MMSARLTPMMSQIFQRVGATVPPPVHRLQYEVVAICNRGSVEDIERIVRRYLQVSQLQALAIESSTQDGLLTRVCVRVAGSILERAELAKLVTRLGLEKAVRSVNWTGTSKRVS